MRLDSPLVQYKKQQLELAIASLVARYYGETGIAVTDINVVHEEKPGERGSINHIITVEAVH